MNLLETIPDFFETQRAHEWIKSGQKVVQELNEAHEIRSVVQSQVPQFVEGKTILSQIRENESKNQLFGFYSSPLWRKFVLCCFLADLVSYPDPSDQVDFPRLAFILSAYPECFRIGMIEIQGRFWPFGYTGSYPISPSTFELLENHPQSLKDRWIPPLTSGDPSYLYLFNYSVAPIFKKTSFSKTLIKHYVQEINAEPGRALACITVSQDGARVAERFGMHLTGQLKNNRHLEQIYVRTPGKQPGRS